MSERTLERRLARSRAVERVDLRRVSSVRCWVRISRWRARLVDLRAEGWGSASRRRVRWARRAVRWDGVVSCEHVVWLAILLFQVFHVVAPLFFVHHRWAEALDRLWRRTGCRCERGLRSAFPALVLVVAIAPSCFDSKPCLAFSNARALLGYSAHTAEVLARSCRRHPEVDVHYFRFRQGFGVFEK